MPTLLASSLLKSLELVDVVVTNVLVVVALTTEELAVGNLVTLVTEELVGRGLMTSRK